MAFIAYWNFDINLLTDLYPTLKIYNVNKSLFIEKEINVNKSKKSCIWGPSCISVVKLENNT